MDRNLQLLERRKDHSLEDWHRWYAAANRSGRAVDAVIEQDMVNAMIDLSNKAQDALVPHGFRFDTWQRSVFCTRPATFLWMPAGPFHPNLLIGSRFVGDTLPYFASGFGDYGVVPCSESAMHCRIADLPVERFILWQVGRRYLASVQYPSPEGPATITFQPATEVLSPGLVEQYSNRIGTISLEHEPLFLLESRIESAGSNLTTGRLTIEVFLASRQAYWHLSADPWNRVELTELLESAGIGQQIF